MLSISVPAAGRLTVVVLSRAPECRRLGSFTRKAHKGVNRIRFTGRLHGQMLKPGTYTLVPYLLRGRPRMLGRVTVQVLAANGPMPAGRRGPLRIQCAASLVAAVASDEALGPSASTASSDSSHLVASGSSGAGRTSGAVAGASVEQLQTASKSDPLADLPFIPAATPVPPVLVGMLALIMGGIAFLVLMMLVLRFLQRNWNP